MPGKMLLNVWPGRWDLASIDPACLAAVMFLQLTCSDEFTIVECTNPDSSPNGQLPYLVYENQTIASLFSIVHFVTSLKSREQIPILAEEQRCSATERAQRTAWTSHVETHLGNLVACSFYSINSNWSKVTNVALCQMLSVPYRYYVPRRLRESVRPRLEAEGLWWSTDEEPVDEKPDPSISAKLEMAKPKLTFSKAFEREKALAKCRTVLDLYSQLLGENTYFFTMLSVLDLIFAAHILLLTRPPFPERSLHQVLDSYPTLSAHAGRILSTIPTPPTQPRTESASFWQLLAPKPRQESAPVEKDNKMEPKLPGLDVDQRRWVWVTMAVAAVTYIAAKSVTITFRVPASAT
ncbi:hypothetical protein BDV98DRAFT_587843 [Pterulicium gracile]|uniref:Mitochondrial outer membrane transport complex Sam37/metaxin N-terminal domain-containing protein n=1 Tax=Pterulicium gracile TaxID=1884261 RepID=A0A5C3R7K3_9AGAR|nr:hypothetical protein BDV98DRAFT_587843 [Pterula gracilis]